MLIGSRFGSALSDSLQFTCVPSDKTRMTQNLLRDVPTDLRDELVEVLARSEQVCIERIVSMGHGTAEGMWYDQDRAEWVVVLQGEAKLLFEGADEKIHLKTGDYVHIPAHARHRVEWTIPDSPTI